MNEEILQTLNKILPVVERVHGEHHPELHKVAELYQAYLTKPSKEIMEGIREVTGDYAVPEDACPTYAKTYELLKALDEATV